MNGQPGNGNEIKLDNELRLDDDFSPPSYEEWRASAEKALKGAPFQKKLVTKTYEGINLLPIYTKEDIKDLPHLAEKPGSDNRMRGNDAAGYHDGRWEISQEIQAGSPKELNQKLKYDLARGQSGITLAGQPPLTTLEDLETALAGIDLTQYPLHIIPGYSGLDTFNQLEEVLDSAGIDKTKVRGSIDADPLGWLASRGSLPVAMDAALNDMAETIRVAEDKLPGFKTTGVCGLPYHDAGADAVKELAYVMASAIHYIDGLQELSLDVKLDVKSIANRMRFTFGVGPFFFMEVAKIRAARILWQRILNAYGVEDAEPMIIHALTSAYNQTLYDPYVNMLRTTTEAFSAIVAGVDGLSTNPFDRMNGNDEEFSRRVARNTQIVLGEECRLDSMIDPAGGSYFVERLTHDTANEAWKIFQEIQASGGMFKALQEGIPQDAIAGTAQKRKADFAKRKTMMVGVNYSANIKEDRPAPANASGIDTAEAGKEAAVTVKPLDIHRLAEMFESLRDKVEDYKENTGGKTGPKLFLAGMGPVSQYKARADFSQAFFEVGGFDVIAPQGPGFDSPRAAIDAALESGAPVVVICSSDDTYPELVPPITKGLKEKNKDITAVLAGYPKDQVEAHKAAGVDEFIYLGADAHRILSEILDRPGVLK